MDDPDDGAAGDDCFVAAGRWTPAVLAAAAGAEEAETEAICPREEAVAVGGAFTGAGAAV